MENKICFVVCSLVYQEIKNVFNEEDYPDVEIKPYPTLCFSDDKKAIWFEKRIENLKKKYDKIVFLGSWCFASRLTKKSSLIDVIVLDHCLEMFLNKEIIFHLIAKKNYLVTKGWLKELKHHKEKWGFDSETAKRFFHESTEGIVLLDTGSNEDYTEKLEELSEYMGVSYTTLPVGLSFCKLFLGRFISEWREKKERINVNRNLLIASQKSADYQLAFNGMQELVELRDENKIITNVFRILDIFFSPREIIYFPFGENLNSNKAMFLKGNSFDIERTNGSFFIELVNTGENFGRLEIIGVSFPEYIERYKEISRIIGMITALAVSNARKFDEIKEQELLLKEKSSALQKEVNTKDLFFSIIAHDLRGPFHGLLGLIEIIKDDITILPVEKINEFLESIHQLATNTYELLEELLMWSRTQQGRTEYDPVLVCFCDIISDVFKVFEERAKQKEIQLIDNCKKIKLFADINMIKTILRNLIGNAIKFTREGGCIEVGAELIDDKWAKIYVKDTGVGMSPEKISKLFELGEKISTHGTRGEGGSGLGLLLCKEFVKIHCGEIWVESAEGKGSHFCFTMKYGELG